MERLVDTYLAQNKLEEGKEMTQNVLDKLHLLGSYESTEQLPVVERIMGKVEAKVTEERARRERERAKEIEKALSFSMSKLSKC